MADMPPKLATLLDTLELISDRSERIALLIDLAKRFREVSARVATRPFSEHHRTPACESEVFVWPEVQPDNTLRFHFAVDNPQGIAAKALAVVLDETLSGAPPEQVAELDPAFVNTMFGNELSMGKSMGLTSMVAMVRGFAAQHIKKETTATPKR